MKHAMYITTTIFIIPSQYRHGADLSLCYQLMWNVTLEYKTTHFNVLGQTRSGNPSPTLHTYTHNSTTSL